MIGTQIKSYKIIDSVGSGGMSNVYLARDLVKGTVVAIKVLKKSYTHENEYIEKYFNREVENTKALNHPNIIVLLDYGKYGENYYLVYEYIQGTTLNKFLFQNKPSLPQIESIAICILSALSFAHRKGIIHRDIKPQNILISISGQVKITDFGISKAISSNTITNTGLFLGSPGYISPEQADPNILKGKEIDGRTDIYSFGILLFEILTGSLPFTSDTPWGIVNKHLNEEPPDIRKLHRNVPNYLAYIIIKCLQKNRNYRFGSSDEIINIIRNKNSPDISTVKHNINAVSDSSSAYVKSISKVSSAPEADTVNVPKLTIDYSKSRSGYASGVSAVNVYSNVLPLWKLFLFSIITLNFYNYYWFYRNWRYLREILQIDIRAGLRTWGLFVPILGWILIYNQYSDIRNLSFNQTGRNFSPGFMIFLHILFSAISRFSTLFSSFNIIYYLLTPLNVIPLAIAQSNWNAYWEKVQPKSKLRNSLTTGEIVTLVLVIIFWIILIVSLSIS